MHDGYRLLSLREVAAELGCTVAMVRELVDTGVIEGYRWPSGHRRIPADAVEKFRAKWLTTPISAKTEATVR